MAHAKTIESEETASIEAIFSIGSNYGDRYEHIRMGLEWLSGHLSNFRSSPIYATPDCHGGCHEYLNAVARGMTLSSPEELDRLCKEYEAANGRNKAMRETDSVPVDIDLVVYDKDVIRPKDFKCEFFQFGYQMI